MTTRERLFWAVVSAVQPVRMLMPRGSWIRRALLAVEWAAYRRILAGHDDNCRGFWWVIP